GARRRRSRLCELRHPRLRIGSRQRVSERGDVVNMTVEVGQAAPDFTLPGIVDGQRRDYTLSEFRGHKVVLAFYPGDDTPGCTRQMCSYRDDISKFEEVDAVLLGISPQDVDSHERWAQKRNFHFPLLADTDRAVAKAYGVAAPLIGIRR